MAWLLACWCAEVLWMLVLVALTACCVIAWPPTCWSGRGNAVETAYLCEVRVAGFLPAWSSSETAAQAADAAEGGKVGRFVQLQRC